MVLKNRSVTNLSEMVNNQRGVFYAHLFEREERKTKEGKPYFRVVFKDANRTVNAVLWEDSPHFADCRDTWQIGTLYKLDAAYSITKYGPQIQIFRIRAAQEEDFKDSLPEHFAIPLASANPEVLYDQAVELAKKEMTKGSPLQLLVLRIFKECRNAVLAAASSRSRHHAYPGGFLEHTLSVTRTALFLADHFTESYPGAKEALSRDLVAAGALLHEIGKIEEMDTSSRIPRHTAEGDLMGYPVLGRDVVRRFASNGELSPDQQMRLEHILVTHPRFADWGAVKPPASLEALIVHQADYADSLFDAALQTLKADTGEAPFTAAAGPFGSPWLKPAPPADRSLFPEEN